MSVMNKKYPECFGDLKTVFPIGENGLRETPESCMACEFKTQCLRSAMMGITGMKYREEIVDRAYESKMIGFFQRWSKKKDLARRMQQKKKKDGTDEDD